MHDRLTNGCGETRTALRLQTIVQPGHHIDVTDPQLPDGAPVEVIIVLPSAPAMRRKSILDIARLLPKTSRSYATWAEFEKRFQEERDSWER